jgi:dipeptidyl aminopeptidase/acylaminoacyl peptidase
MPGDKDIPQEHLYIFDIEHNTYKEINTKAFKDQSLDIAYKPRQRTEQGIPEVARQWAGTNTQLFITRSSRDLHRIDICKYVLGEDTLRPVIEERMNTYQEVRPLGVLDGGEELLQWSERDGWAHLYLYDGEGKLKKQLTQGAWHVMNIEKIDEKNRVVYFTANGKNPDENPYYQHVYKVSLNGGEVKEISKGNYFHEPFIDDEATYFIDNYSRIDCQPKTALFSTSGAKIMDLEEADMSQLLANGYQYPEQFTVKAADGVTDLWGVMYKPFNFDSTRVYPIIDYVYPGPQVEATNYIFTKMGLRTDCLAQAGFIVVTVGNRGGHPDRSKWYHNYGYGNLRDYGLADQKAAIEQLANR